MCFYDQDLFTDVLTSFQLALQVVHRQFTYAPHTASCEHRLRRILRNFTDAGSGERGKLNRSSTAARQHGSEQGWQIHAPSNKQNPAFEVTREEAPLVCFVLIRCSFLAIVVADKQ